MRTLMVTAAAVTVAVISGCGAPRPVQPAGRPGSPDPDPSVAASAGCPGYRPAAPGRGLTISVSDNGRSFCVAPGTPILVILQGTLDRKWAPIEASSGALVRRPDGRLMLVVGATGASFSAARPGRAVITSARPVCAGSVPVGSSPSPASSASSARCSAELAFRAVVVVRR